MNTEKTQELYEKALNWIYRSKFHHVKAKVEPFEEPKAFHRSKDDLTFTPDITAERGGKKFYFDIAIKDEAHRQLAGKWQLMQRLASIKGGKLFLLAPHGHKAFTERIVGTFGIEAKIVNLA
ncbi:MAG: hypothetical protein R2830_13065 [Saprospiraceae bacterium]